MPLQFVVFEYWNCLVSTHNIDYFKYFRVQNTLALYCKYRKVSWTTVVQGLLTISHYSPEMQTQFCH